jgi:hypothetical protein
LRQISRCWGFCFGTFFGWHAGQRGTVRRPTLNSGISTRPVFGCGIPAEDVRDRICLRPPYSHSNLGTSLPYRTERVRALFLPNLGCVQRVATLSDPRQVVASMNAVNPMCELKPNEVSIRSIRDRSPVAQATRRDFSRDHRDRMEGAESPAQALHETDGSRQRPEKDYDCDWTRTHRIHLGHRDQGRISLYTTTGSMTRIEKQKLSK